MQPHNHYHVILNFNLIDFQQFLAVRQTNQLS